MVVPLNSPQPTLTFPSLNTIQEDFPKDGDPASVGLIGALALPEIVFGAAPLSAAYNSEDFLTTDLPLRTVRLALRYGIRAFDTSAYYGVSEIVLGEALKTLQSEFPRSSYQILSKCGRYGLHPHEFDYTPPTLRASIKRSLTRLNTPYLDTVFLHDVEFVCTQVQARDAGDHTTALTTERDAYGLGLGSESKIFGDGDQKVLEAVNELWKMKDEGLIRNVGISGYQLSTVLRLAILVKHTSRPLDVVMSYSHLNLANKTFVEFLPHFLQRAGVKQLLSASPFNMGLLTPKGPPAWHLAPPALRQVARDAVKLCDEQGVPGGLPNVALGYSLRTAGFGEERKSVPTVIGFSKPEEVHEAMQVWREIHSGIVNESRREAEVAVMGMIEEAGQMNWSWASPP